MGVTSKTKMKIQILLTLTAAAVVLGAPDGRRPKGPEYEARAQYNNDDITKRLEEVGPVMSDSLEKRSANGPLDKMPVVQQAMEMARYWDETKLEKAQERFDEDYMS